MQIPNSIIEPAVTLKDQYFDLRGLSAYSALAVGTLRDHIWSGGLPAFKVRGKVLIKQSEFDLWLEGFRIEQNLDNIVDEVMDSLKG